MTNLLVIIALINCLVIASADPFTVETLHQIRRVGEFDVNSVGDVVYSLREWDPTTNLVTTNIQIQYGDADDPFPLTYSEGDADGQPQFSSDESTVFFLSDRSGSSQIWGVPAVNGSEDNVFQVTNFSVDIDNFKLFAGPDGDHFLYTIQVYTDCDTLQCTADRDAKVASRRENTWRYYTELFVRHWDKWLTGKLSHIFVQKISLSDGVWSLVGTPLDLMKGMPVNSPVPPFGGLEQIDVASDGSEIAFTGAVVDATSSWSTGWKTYIVPSDGSGNPTSIAEFTTARTTNPRYSPDGQYIAYLAMDRAGFEADKLHVNLYTRATQQTTPFTSAIDISFTDIQWDATSAYLIGDADYFGIHAFFPIPIAGGPPSALKPISTAGTSQTLVRYPSTNEFVFSLQSMTSPVDLWYFNISVEGGFQVGALVQLTDENDDLLSNVEFVKPQRFSFTGSLGDTVYGWVLPPYNYQSGVVPVAHLVHGGPQGTWGDDWSYRWNPQVWAGHGYAVLMVDFHGSTGYGQAFTDAISGNWGSYPYWDVMNGTFAAIAQFPFLDKTRVGALGASYGGYMINWIHGHTDFFKALVTHDGIFDTLSGYYSTEELWFPEWEFRGTPWQNSTLYNQWNPAAFVSNWKVPHLIIHGGHDYRLPITHGLSAFTALQRRGIPSAFLEFDLENHWVLNDNNGIKWYHTVLDWLDQYVAPQ